jgi:hypothetical protein
MKTAELVSSFDRSFAMTPTPYCQFSNEETHDDEETFGGQIVRAIDAKRLIRAGQKEIK